MRKLMILYHTKPISIPSLPQTENFTSTKMSMTIDSKFINQTSSILTNRIKSHQTLAKRMQYFWLQIDWQI